jgi:hypothetical protein
VIAAVIICGVKALDFSFVIFLLPFVIGQEATLTMTNEK